MKQNFMLITLLVVTFTLANAQSEYSPSNYKSFESKLDKSNKTIEDPKKKDLAKTWMERAKLFQDIADFNTQLLRLNMHVAEIKLLLKNPKDIKKTTMKEGNTEHQIDQYIYDNFSLNI